MQSGNLSQIALPNMCLQVLFYEAKEIPDLSFSNQTRFYLKSILNEI